MPARHLAATVPVVALVTLLASCGGSTGATPDAGPTPAPTTSAGSPEPSTATTADSAPPSMTALDLSQQDPAGFTAQGRSVACLFSTVRDVASVRCDVLGATWSTPQKPPDCRGDWGISAGITAGRPGELLCISDTVVGIPGATDGSAPLREGTVVTYGPLLCTLQSNGVSCFDTGSGGEHSLFVSALTYEVI